MSLRDKQKTNELWKPDHKFAFYWESDVKKCMENIVKGLFNKDGEFSMNAKTALVRIEADFGFKIAELTDSKDGGKNGK